MKALAHMRPATAKVEITLAGLDDADDWQIENNTTCTAEVVPQRLGEAKALAKKFIVLYEGAECFHSEGAI